MRTTYKFLGILIVILVLAFSPGYASAGDRNHGSRSGFGSEANSFRFRGRVTLRIGDARSSSMSREGRARSQAARAYWHGEPPTFSKAAEMTGWPSKRAGLLSPTAPVTTAVSLPTSSVYDGPTPSYYYTRVYVYTR